MKLIKSLRQVLGGEVGEGYRIDVYVQWRWIGREKYMHHAGRYFIYCGDYDTSVIAKMIAGLKKSKKQRYSVGDLIAEYR